MDREPDVEPEDDEESWEAGPSHWLTLVLPVVMAAALATFFIHMHVTTRRAERAYDGPPPSVSVAPPPEPSLPIEQVEALHDALMAADYATLERRLAWHADSARADPDYELRYRVAFDVFANEDPDFRSPLDAWIAASPTSAAAHLARASHFTAMGWAARGGAWASKTSRERFRRMHEWFGLAERDIAAAKRVDSTNVMVYWLTLGLVSGGNVDARRALDDGLRHVPGSLLLRVRYQYYLRPRWNTSPSLRPALVEMDIFATESDRAARINPRLRLVRGMIPYDRAEMLSSDDLEEQAIEMYTRAIRFGDYWMFRLGRADAYYYDGQYRLAKDDYDAVLAELPTSTEARARRAGACLRLAARLPPGVARDTLLHRAREDIRLATKLDPEDPALRSVLRRNSALRPPTPDG